MRRIKIAIIMMTVLILALAGCGKKTEGDTANNKDGQTTSQNVSGTKTFVSKEEGFTSEVTYSYADGKVTNLSMENTSSYDYLDVANQYEAQQLMQNTVNSYANIEGVRYDIEYGEKELLEKLMVDCNVAKLDDIRGIPGIAIDGDKISMEKSEAMLAEAGYTMK